MTDAPQRGDAVTVTAFSSMARQGLAEDFRCRVKLELEGYLPPHCGVPEVVGAVNAKEMADGPVAFVSGAVCCKLPGI